MERFRRISRIHALRRQRGITTLFVSILLLIILTVAILFSANVSVFEQRTTTNENRARLAKQASESALNLAAEYLKANAAQLTSTAAGGWLNAGTTPRWTQCTDAVALCLTEQNATRRARMYYTTLPVTNAMASGADRNLVTQVELADGVATNATTTVGALLCRFDRENPSTTNPCVLNPGTPGPLAITVISQTTIGGESAVAETKEMFATFNALGGIAEAPLIASGTISGLDSMEVVAAPNGGGTGIPVSIWSPCPVDIEAGSTGAADPLCPAAGGGGIGSVITCHLGDYLADNVSPENFLTGCPGNNGCGCPNDLDVSLSGHSGPDTEEGIDILDIDGGPAANGGVNEDITYFPREPHDSPTDPLDDSMFEAIFGSDVVDEGQTSVRQTCGAGGDEDCAKVALRRLRPVELAACSDVPSGVGGFYWIRHAGGGNCSLPSTVGSPAVPAVIVVEGGDVRLPGNITIYGMLFVRSSTNAATMTGGANSTYIYGSVVVEGQVDMTGLNLVYSEEIANRILFSPAFSRFGRVPGSWLDSQNRL